MSYCQWWELVNKHCNFLIPWYIPVKLSGKLLFNILFICFSSLPVWLSHSLVVLSEITSQLKYLFPNPSHWACFWENPNQDSEKTITNSTQSFILYKIYLSNFQLRRLCRLWTFKTCLIFQSFPKPQAHSSSPILFPNLELMLFPVTSIRTLVHLWFNSFCCIYSVSNSTLLVRY